MKRIRLTCHAIEQCKERGATEDEVLEAVLRGTREPAKLGREICRCNFAFGEEWRNEIYAIKQVAPVVKEESEEIVVITVYAFYF